MPCALQKVEDTLQKAIVNCPPVVEGKPVTPEDIEIVEIVGGSSRIPAVKALIKKVLFCFWYARHTFSLNVTSSISL